MPDQPTSPASTPPGQNLAGHLVSLLVRDPRWASGPATGRDLETEPFYDLLRDHLRAAGADLAERSTEDGDHQVVLALDGITATITGPTPGIALTAMLLTVWGTSDELDELDEFAGGEE